MYILCPAGELRAKVYKIGSLTPLKIDPLIQSQLNEFIKTGNKNRFVAFI